MITFYLSLILLMSSSILVGMDSLPVSRTAHQALAAELTERIKVTENEIANFKNDEAHNIALLHRKVDRTSAVGPLALSLLISGKLAYDIYSMVEVPLLSSWLTIANITVDSAALTYLIGSGTYHLVRSCCRKPVGK